MNIAAFVSLVLAALANSSVENVPAVALPDTCEIHVWAAEKLNTLTEGAVWNNTLNSALPSATGKTRVRPVPAGRLEGDSQASLLRDIDLGEVLHHPGAKIFMQDGPSARRSTGAVAARQASSTSQCYVEFTVAKNFFNRSGLAGRTLRTLFVLDDFGDKPVPQHSFMGWASTDLQIFPATKPALMQAADDELAKAFQANTLQFARYAFAPRKKR